MWEPGQGGGGEGEESALGHTAARPRARRFSARPRGPEGGEGEKNRVRGGEGGGRENTIKN